MKLVIKEKLFGRLRRMPWRFTIAAVALSAAVAAVIYHTATCYFVENAEEQVCDLLLQHRALNRYLQREGHPALFRFEEAGEIDSDFYSPELLSSTYMARHINNYLNEERRVHGLREIHYRIAAINPRNPVNAPNERDLELIDLFNRDRERSSYREVLEADSGDLLFVAFPFLETHETCLRCHGDPAMAPHQLRERYGLDAGFNAQLGKIRAIETVEVPIEPELRQAQILVLALAAGFLCISVLVMAAVRLRRAVRWRTDDLAESERKYRSVVEDLPCLVCGYLPDGTITFVNRQYALYFGRSAEELIGSRLTDLAPGADWKEVQVQTTRLTLEPPIRMKEHRVVAADGSIRWLRWTHRALLDDQGNPVAFQAFGEDITDRKSAVDELKRERDKAQQYLDLAGVMFVALDASGEVTLINRKGCEILGYAADEIVGKDWFTTFLPPNTGDNMRAVFRRLLVGEIELVEYYENPVVTKAGDERIIAWHNTPLRDEKGDIIGTLSSGEDVTARERTARALHEREAFSRAIIDNSPAGISVRSPKGKLLFANKAWREIYALTEDQVAAYLQEDPSELWLKDYLSDYREEIEKVYREGGLFHIPELYIKDAPAQARWVSLTYYAIEADHGGVDRVVILTQDITERKAAEQKLGESERRRAALLDAIPDMMFVLKADGTLIDFKGSDRGLNMPGHDLIGRRIDDAPMPESVNTGLKRSVRSAIESGTLRTLEYDVPTPYGVTSVEARFVKCTDNTALCIVRDVTDRKRAEEALRQSEERYRSYVDNAPEGIFVVDRQGRLVEANPAIQRMTGYTYSEIRSMTIDDFLAPELRESGRRQLELAVVTGRAMGDVIIRGKNGEQMWWSISGVKLSEDRYLGFGIDVTETRRLRELESRAQRLETAGRIAGQVAHDFNNLLGPLMAYPDLIREDLPKNHPALAYVGSIEEAAQRIADINQQLLTLGRRGHYNQEPLNLNEVVRHVLREMDSPADTLVYETDLADDLMNIMGGRAQIYRAFMNLVQNARDATRDVGRLTVRTENYYVDDVSVTYARVPKGEYVKLTLSDSGCGIAEEILPKIFDPFFTSKTTDRKRGSGLGLSVVDAVMKDHRGYIDLRSKVGEGTAIYLYFPLTREAAGIDAADAIAGGSESILVVDDDQTQRDVALQILSRLGYQAETVAGGEQALDLVKRRPFDLLVLDMVMPPGMDGTETYRRAVEINPGQRAIIVSGFAETDRVAEAQRMGAGAFIRKPLTRSTLARAIRRELERVARQPVGV